MRCRNPLPREDEFRRANLKALDIDEAKALQDADFDRFPKWSKFKVGQAIAKKRERGFDRQTAARSFLRFR